MSFLEAHAGSSPQQEAHRDSSRPWFHNQDMPGLEMALSALFLRPSFPYLSLSVFPSPSPLFVLIWLLGKQKYPIQRSWSLVSPIREQGSCQPYCPSPSSGDSHVLSN